VTQWREREGGEFSLEKKRKEIAQIRKKGRTYFLLPEGKERFLRSKFWKGGGDLKEIGEATSRDLREKKEGGITLENHKGGGEKRISLQWRVAIVRHEGEKRKRKEKRKEDLVRLINRGGGKKKKVNQKSSAFKNKVLSTIAIIGRKKKECRILQRRYLSNHNNLIIINRDRSLVRRFRGVGRWLFRGEA